MSCVFNSSGGVVGFSHVNSCGYLGVGRGKMQNKKGRKWYQGRVWKFINKFPSLVWMFKLGELLKCFPLQTKQECCSKSAPPKSVRIPGQCRNRGHSFVMFLDIAGNCG